MSWWRLGAFGRFGRLVRLQVALQRTQALLGGLQENPKRPPRELQEAPKSPPREFQELPGHLQAFSLEMLTFHCIP